MSQKNSEVIAALCQLTVNAIKDYNIFYDLVNQEDKRTQDILHRFELEKMSPSTKGKLTTELGICRKDRRYYKDRVEELQPFVDFMKDQNNTKAINNLTQVLGAVRKQESFHATRVYKPRILKDNNSLGTVK